MAALWHIVYGVFRYCRRRRKQLLLCIQAAVLFLIWKWAFRTLERSPSLFEDGAVENKNNPLLSSMHFPRFSDIKVEHVIPAIMLAAERFQSGLERHVEWLKSSKLAERTWKTVVEPLEVLEFPFGYTWNIVSHIYSVKNSPSLRSAYQQVQPVQVNLKNNFSQSLPIYSAFKELSSSQALDGVQSRIIQTFLLSAQHGGVELQGDSKKRFNHIHLQLANLTTKFRNNILDATKAFSLLLTNISSVKGLPETARQLLADNAVLGTDQRSDPDHGPWKVTLDDPSYYPVMKYSNDRALRKMLFHARISRAGSGEFDNSGIIEEIRKLRQEIAEILGYRNYAEVSVVSKMAQRVPAVWNLLRFLRNHSYTVAQQELVGLKEFAKTSGFTEELEHWDVMYWTEKQQKALFNVLSGLFQLSSDLFGIKIVPADGAAEVWDPAVRFFNIYDEKETHIASFYLDPYSRPHEKSSGAWMLDFISRSRQLKNIPVAILVCNQIPPVGSKPSLMSFAEVSTLFHEFGHGLQHMLTTVPHAAASGTNNIEWDAVEVASQFMENWLYDHRTVMSISGHFQTGESLPLHMFEQILRARYFHGGSAMLGQLYLAALDMELHTSPDPWITVKKRITDQFSILKPPSEDRFPCTFQHIFGGDSYAAGYYSYKWAEVLAQDLFGAFEEAGLQNREKMSALGHRYRETVLSLGGGTPPQEVFRMFRGRDPSAEVLLRSYGLL
ncbi:probable cytosolic oligopeptidase A isoform X2 [Protopterus annectens]|uniref:probable cytosolic oligopeptidase A isoform X2 n=1 Tax=Protopterus annectens TaxID=7888 RepID=UPI001CFA9AEC|nr:probable cytosolic oligopeptidase A isoform X2 [Protopterus annectens]